MCCYQYGLLIHYGPISVTTERHLGPAKDLQLSKFTVGEVSDGQACFIFFVLSF
jgi:hypothetical protein